MEKCAVQCKNLNGRKVLKHVVDLRNDELVQKAVNKTAEEFGKIDVVINSAGIFPNNRGILDPKAMETYDFVMAVNLRGLVYVTKCAAPYLTKSKGCFIDIASLSALIPTLDSFACNISKSAVGHMTKCAALELARYGVRANAIMPGAAKINIFINCCDDMSFEANNKCWKSMRCSTQLKLLIEPKEIADMASDAKNITEADFKVDGGLSLCSFIVPPIE